MPNCSAIGCSNSFLKGYRLFSFPANKKLRSIWEINVSREHWKATPHSRLCEIHFETSEFELKRLDGKKKLRWNAIPTKFVHPAPIGRLPKPTAPQSQNHDHTYSSNKETNASVYSAITLDAVEDRPNASNVHDIVNDNGKESSLNANEFHCPIEATAAVYQHNPTMLTHVSGSAECNTQKMLLKNSAEIETQYCRYENALNNLLNKDSKKDHATEFSPSNSKDNGNGSLNSRFCQKSKNLAVKGTCVVENKKQKPWPPCQGNKIQGILKSAQLALVNSGIKDVQLEPWSKLYISNKQCILKDMPKRFRGRIKWGKKNSAECDDKSLPWCLVKDSKLMEEALISQPRVVMEKIDEITLQPYSRSRNQKSLDFLKKDTAATSGSKMGAKRKYENLTKEVIDLRPTKYSELPSVRVISILPSPQNLGIVNSNTDICHGAPDHSSAVLEASSQEPPQISKLNGPKFRSSNLAHCDITSTLNSLLETFFSADKIDAAAPQPERKMIYWYHERPMRVYVLNCGHACRQCNSIKISKWLHSNGHITVDPLITTDVSPQPVINQTSAEKSSLDALILKKLSEISQMIQASDRNDVALDSSKSILKFIGKQNVDAIESRRVDMDQSFALLNTGNIADLSHPLPNSQQIQHCSSLIQSNKSAVQQSPVTIKVDNSDKSLAQQSSVTNKVAHTSLPASSYTTLPGSFSSTAITTQAQPNISLGTDGPQQLVLNSEPDIIF